MNNRKSTGKHTRRIILVRHGTPLGYDGPMIYRGQMDIELSPGGIAEARAIGSWFAGSDFHGRIYSSPLKRAFNTASIIANEIATGKAYQTEISVNPLLKEIDVGAWEGLSMDDVKARYSEEYLLRGRKMYETQFPEGESFAELGIRFTSAVNAILAENADNKLDIMIVSHSGVICSYLVELGFLAPDEVKSLNIPCAGICILRQCEDGELMLEAAGIKPVAVLTADEINRLYEKYKVPENIRAHMLAVADFQDRLLDDLEQYGLYYDREVLRKAARLHDIARLEPQHATVGAKLMHKEGYPEIAELIRHHHSSERTKGKADALSHAGSELSPEDILFYADKRVHGTDIVSLRDRFDRSLKKCIGDDALAHHQALYRKALEIEEAINTLLSSEAY